tara:strand:+ start:214 stop:612 length:399 start_codon:yes stop_codon:yes gene_type:complete
MVKNYLAKIIAKDVEGLKTISACCFNAKVKISELKYLQKNKIFLLFLVRYNRESQKNNEKINSVCKFEFVDKVKSKNIDQNNQDLILELISVDLLKKKEKFQINLIFSNNSYITMFTEIVEVTLEDQNKEFK